jgi:hypothetical protein
MKLRDATCSQTVWATGQSGSGNKRVGGVAVMSRRIALEGEHLGEGKAQEGHGPEQVLIPPAWETDSQGEQSREVGQRHSPHLLEVTG